MEIRICAIKAAASKKLLNTEFFILENHGDTAFSTRNCILSVTPKNSKKKTNLGTMDPGFSLAPGDKVRVITGNPGRKAQGKAPVDDVPNYHLFLGNTILRGVGSNLAVTLRSFEIAKASYDPQTESGVGEQPV